MPKTNIKCLSCSNVIGQQVDNKVIFPSMKDLSIIEFNLEDSSRDVKCRCGNWNTFDKNNNQTINYQRKGADALYSATNVVYRGSNLKVKK